MRSSWERDAVWATFTSGPYVNNPASGEMSFDQGALAVVRGGRPLLVNTAAALYRHRPGTTDGVGNVELVYADLYGRNAADPRLRNRTLYNVFSVKAPRFGQIPRVRGEARTKMGAFEDGSAYVHLRGDGLEDMYWPESRTEPRLVASWSRQVTYLHPGRFVVIDRTEAGDGRGINGSRSTCQRGP